MGRENYNHRKIGSYEGCKNETLFICFGAMHGNEPAGLRAIELVLKMLEMEPSKNPAFSFNGKFVGFIGNMQALKEGKRFIKKDLNRKFIDQEVTDILSRDENTLSDEDLELSQLVRSVLEEVNSYQPKKLVVLDLHTTSSYGGIFTICRRDASAIKIATALHAPVVLGMLDGLRGTTLHYFTSANMGLETIALTFESGQHQERLSVNRAIAGIISILREVGIIRADDVENYHEEILIEFSENLPKLTTLIEKYDIIENDGFKMNPGYKNFQKVKKGECIAHNHNGDIYAKDNGRILMPLYQDQGEDGYFLIKDISHDYGI